MLAAAAQLHQAAAATAAGNKSLSSSLLGLPDEAAAEAFASQVNFTIALHHTFAQLIVSSPQELQVPVALQIQPQTSCLRRRLALPVSAVIMITPQRLPQSFLNLVLAVASRHANRRG